MNFYITNKEVHMKDKIFIVTGAVAGAAIFAVLLFSLF